MKYILGFLIALFAVSAMAEVEPIKHPTPTVTRTISRSEVYWMYTMRTRFWDTGHKITVFYMDYKSPVHEEFVYKVLRTTPSAFAQSVAVYVNSGNAAYYRRIPEGSQMHTEVAKTVGAIGYLDKNTVMINKGNGDVQTLTISD